MTRRTSRRLHNPAARVPEAEQISRLLRPFLAQPLEPPQLRAISTHLDMLLRWNSRLNLTAVREPIHIVTRHFGESLFAAAFLLQRSSRVSAIDVGSGAGFPGLPFKIYAADMRLTLIESQQKKATFLKEVVRALQLTDVDVFAGRAEAFAGCAQLVTLRAVERFEQALPIAAALLHRPDSRREQQDGRQHRASRLALLIGASQAERARNLLPRFKWEEAIPIPESSARILLVGVPE